MLPSEGQLSTRRFMMSESWISHSCCALFFLASHWSRVWNVTWEHSKNGCEGIELEAVDDVAKVANFYGHEDAPGGQKEDVQALCHDAQPQHSCKRKQAGLGRRARVTEAEDRLRWTGGGSVSWMGRRGEAGAGEQETKDKQRQMKRTARTARCWWTTEPAADLHSLRGETERQEVVCIQGLGSAVRDETPDPEI